MSVQPNNPFASSVMYRVGGRSYALRAVRGCSVCNSPWRAAVENYLLQGHSYQTIASRLPEDANLSRDNIKHHFKAGHLPLAEDARRAIIERRATELEWDPDSNADRMIDALGFLRLGLSDVASRMMSREIEPDIKDGIAMAKALSQLEIDDDTEDRLAMYASLIRLMFEAAQRHMDHQGYQDFSQELMDSPVFRSMMGMPEPAAVSAGVITVGDDDEDDEAV
jgi:hypothetical protein